MAIYTINLGSLLRRTARKHPDRVALVSQEGKRLTYRDFEDLSNRFANGLLRLGIKKNDKIALLSLNSNEQLIAFFGIFKMGGILVPINARLATAEMAWILEHSESTCMIFSHDFQVRHEALQSQPLELRTHIVIGDKASSGEVVTFEEVLDQGGGEEPPVEVLGDDVALLVYTAGTTGRPKGVLLTHNSAIWNCVNWAHSGTYREGDLVLQVFPLYHMAAIGNVLTYIYMAGTNHLKKTFDPKECMETIGRERINRWAAAPTVFNMLLQLPGIDLYDTSTVTLLGSGAAIMPVETRRRIRSVFPKARLFDNYGMTEAAGGITTLGPEDAERKEASVGKPLISVEMLVVDDNDRPVPPGEVGEVVFRGNNLMKGYYKDPQATEEAMRGGWMHTGDLGRLDEEGFLYVVDRKKDMIITGGENVYPREVEEVLYAHPNIAEAAVIGVPDPKWGEAIKAVVTLKSDKTISERELIDFCRERIAGFKCPKSVEVVQELPKNPAGKILKRTLREDHAKG